MLSAVPLQEVECAASHMCQMVDIPCVDGVCPAIPQCVPVLPAAVAPACPQGEPYTLPETNATLACSPRARALECPQGFSCYAGDSTVEGVCCPSPGRIYFPATFCLVLLCFPRLVAVSSVSESSCLIIVCFFIIK